MSASAFRTTALLTAVGALLMVQGCREDEQDRVLVHEKGVYQGAEDPDLDFTQLEELRSRARSQKF